MNNDWKINKKTGEKERDFRNGKLVGCKHDWKINKKFKMKKCLKCGRAQGLSKRQSRMYNEGYNMNKIDELLEGMSIELAGSGSISDQMRKTYADSLESINQNSVDSDGEGDSSLDESKTVTKTFSDFLNEKELVENLGLKAHKVKTSGGALALKSADPFAEALITSVETDKDGNFVLKNKLGNSKRIKLGDFRGSYPILYEKMTTSNKKKITDFMGSDNTPDATFKNKVILSLKPDRQKI